MNYNIAKKAVESAKLFLQSITQVDCISTDNNSKIISWLGRKPGIFKNHYYPIEYQYLLDNHQYSLLLSDSSFFQFFYKFDGNNKLEKARLAYYPNPISTSDTKDSLLEASEKALESTNQDLFDLIFNTVEYMELLKNPPSNTSHIRFDYDPTAASHAPSHIQFSGIQELRVPANFFPLPLTFIEMCATMLNLSKSCDASSLVFEKRNSHDISSPNSAMFLINN